MNFQCGIAYMHIVCARVCVDIRQHFCTFTRDLLPFSNLFMFYLSLSFSISISNPVSYWVIHWPLILFTCWCTNNNEWGKKHTHTQVFVHRIGRIFWYTKYSSRNIVLDWLFQFNAKSANLCIFQSWFSGSIQKYAKLYILLVETWRFTIGFR